MPNRDFNELVAIVRPPAPEIPPAVRQERERQGIFHSHEPGQAPRGPESDAREFKPDRDAMHPVHMDRAEVCVLDERGGHLRLGQHCPHFKGYDKDEVTEVTF